MSPIHKRRSEITPSLLIDFNYPLDETIEERVADSTRR